MLGPDSVLDGLRDCGDDESRRDEMCRATSLVAQTDRLSVRGNL